MQVSNYSSIFIVDENIESQPTKSSNLSRRLKCSQPKSSNIGWPSPMVGKIKSFYSIPIFVDHKFYLFWKVKSN